MAKLTKKQKKEAQKVREEFIRDGGIGIEDFTDEDLLEEGKIEIIFRPKPGEGQRTDVPD